MRTEPTTPDAMVDVGAGSTPAQGLLSLPGTLTTFGDPNAGACVDGYCAVPMPDTDALD